MLASQIASLFAEHRDGVTSLDELQGLITHALDSEKDEAIKPSAWLHYYRKPGKAYCVASLSQHADPDPGFEIYKSEPLWKKLSAQDCRLIFGYRFLLDSYELPTSIDSEAVDSRILELLVENFEDSFLQQVLTSEREWSKQKIDSRMLRFARQLVALGLALPQPGVTNG